jgi:hypothetical protein
MSKIRETRLFTIFTAILLPIILVVITLAVSGVFSRKGTHIAIELLQKGVLVDVDERIVPDVSVSYKNTPISRLLVARIRIRNTGAQGISHEADVVQALTFSFPDGQVRILGDGVVQEKKPDEIVVSQELSEDGSALQVEFDLLNKGWFFVFDILYSGPETCLPIVKGKIKNVGMEEVTSVLDRTAATIESSVELDDLTAPTISLLVGVFVPLYLLLLLLLDATSRSPVAAMFRYCAIIIYSGTAIYALVMGSLFSVRYFKGSSGNVFFPLGAILVVIVALFAIIKPHRKEPSNAGE